MFVFLLPAFINQTALRNGVNVVSERQRDHVGLQSVDDRPALLARSAVRLLDRDLLSFFFLPIGREGFVIVLV
ncbi:hypothetical protein D3C76_1559690 [compost metagenome]